MNESTNNIVAQQQDSESTDDVLAGLVNPDEPVETPTFQYNDETQHQILAAMFHEADILDCAAKTLNPKAFTVKGLSTAARIAIDYWDRYRKVPPKLVLHSELERELRDAKALPFYKGLVNAVYDYTYQCEAKEWVKHKLIMFAKTTAIHQAFRNYLKGLEDGKLDIDELHKGYCDEFQKIKALAVTEDELVGLDAVEFFEFASQKEREWLLEGWIAEGSIHLLAGEKKLGKSTLLLSMIPALVTGRPWCDAIGTIESHVVYIDFENPADYIRDNLLANMPRPEWEAVRDRLSVPRKLPGALTGEWLTQYIEKNGLGGKKLIVFIDSAFAAFNALFAGAKRVWENTGSDVRTAMLPLAEVARQTGAAVVLIHHDNKSGDTTGSGQWEGAVDYVWHYTKDGRGRKLSAKWGRWVAAKPTSLVFEYDDRLALVGTAGQVKQKERDGRLEELLRIIPDLELDAEPTEGNTVTQAELREQLGLSSGEVSVRLQQLQKDGRIKVGKVGNGNPTRLPNRYWQHSCLSWAS